MISRALLYIVYFVLITPIGICLRLFSVDLLRVRRRQNEKTYWVQRRLGFERKSLS